MAVAGIHRTPPSRDALSHHSVLAALSGDRRPSGGRAAAPMGVIAPTNRRAWIGSGLVVCAATFNMGLCFLNTHVMAINVGFVIASEFLIIGLAAAASYRVLTP